MQSSTQRSRRHDDRFFRWFLILAGMLLVGYTYWIAVHRHTHDVLPKQRHFAEIVPLGFIERNVSLTTIMAAPSEPGNAADLYMEAMRPFDYERAHKEGYEAKDLAQIDPEGQEIALIIEAAAIKECRFSPKYYPFVTSKDHAIVPGPILEAFATRMSERVDAAISRSYTAFEVADKEAAIQKARKTAEGLVMLGRHLADERLSVKQVLIGEQIANLGAEKLRKVAWRLDDAAAVAAAQRYHDEGRLVRRRLEHKIAFLVPLKEEYTEAVIKVALYDEDPAFRGLAYSILQENRAGFLFGESRASMETAHAQLQKEGFPDSVLATWSSRPEEQ